MNRIVPWQIAMVLVTIGTYAAVLASGGSAQAAAGAAGVAVTIVGAGAAIVVAPIVMATALVAGAAATADAAIAAIAVVVVVADTKKDIGVPKRWMFTAYGIEMGAVFSALLTGSIGWAIAIGAAGILALRAVWKLGPVAARVAAGATLAPKPNGG